MLLRHAWLLLLCACSSVPEIQFSDVDGQAEAGPDAPGEDDGAPDDAMPAGDGGSDATDDGNVGPGCPGVVPPGAVLCCGAVPCYGKNCGSAACTDCQSKCSPGTACCPNQGGKATCTQDASTCP